MMIFSQCTRGHLRTFSLSAVVLALAACSALPTPPTQPTRFDLGMVDLQPSPVNAAAPSVASPPLVLAEIQTPGVSDGSTAMLYRLNYSDSQQLRAYQNARWVQPPAQMLEQRLRLRLALTRPVLTERDNLSAHPDDKRPLGFLRVDVAEFSQVFDSAQSSQAVVRLRASLIAQDKRGGNILLGQKLLVAQTPATTADAAGGARAMTASVDDVLKQLDLWLQSQGR